MTHEHPLEPRCATCDSVLVHAGAICHICSADALYGAPPARTSPVLQLPERDDELLAVLRIAEASLGQDGSSPAPSSA